MAYITDKDIDKLTSETGKALAAQPKVTIMIDRSIGEYWEGGINGHMFRIKTGEMVEVPKGYHPFTVAPGYKNYCLWIMAGKDRGIFCTTEEEHKWIVK